MKLIEDGDIPGRAPAHKVIDLSITLFYVVTWYIKNFMSPLALD